MSRNSFSRENRVARRVSIAGGLLFCLYSYFFLVQGFGDQLQVVGSEYSRLLALRVPIASWMVALWMVVILQGIQVLIKSVLHLETRFLIVSYVPSFCGLLLFVWISGSTFNERTMYTNHLIVAGFFVLLLIVWVLKHLLAGEDNRALRDPVPNFPAWRSFNLFLFALCVFVVGLLSPMKQSARNEAAMMQAVQENQFSRVLEIDRSNLHPSLKMTQLRNRALLQSNMLGERMFEYPQNYGISGLERRGNAGDNSLVTKDYELRLAQLLLEKDLNAFMEELANYAQYFSGKELPKHYKEAYAFYVYMHPDKPYLIQDTNLRMQFVAYLNERNKYRTEEERKAILGTTEFRSTYWWYYEFVLPEEKNAEV